MALTSIFATASGSLSELTVGDVSVLLYPASPVADGPAGLWLRRRPTEVAEIVSIVGQNAVTHSEPAGSDVLARSGRWGDLLVSVRLRRSDQRAAWFWHVRVVNEGTHAVELDLLHTQDVALAPIAAVRTNEYYVSQYLDLTPVQTVDHGVAIGIRQNMPGPTPWALIGCLGRADGWSTDARQLTGRGRPDGTAWPGLMRDLPATRLQGEHTLAALQTAPRTLRPGETWLTGFYGLVIDDHPDRTSDADAGYVDEILDDPAAWPADAPVDDYARALGEVDEIGDHRSLFATATPLACRALSDAELDRLVDAERDQVERDGTVLLSFFTTDGGQLVTAEKQARVLRPHGQILRSGRRLIPEETSVCATAWMDGTFCSQLTHGHVGLGTILSPRRSYLGLAPAHGLRMFVRIGGRQPWRLLGTPSAWHVGPDRCRWFYAFDESLIEVVTTVPADRDEVEVRVAVHHGPPVDLLTAAHVTWLDSDTPPGAVEATWSGVRAHPPVNGVTDRLFPGGRLDLYWSSPSTEVADDAALFVDGRSRGEPWITLLARERRDWELVLAPRLIPDTSEHATPPPGGEHDFWCGLASAIELIPPRTPAGRELDRLASAVPWFVHDAVVHYLSPRGLEQYSGGAWGTRDVCQGPVGLLLALDAHRELRELVLRVMAAQQVRGDWPQAFEFLDRHRHGGTGESHGDVIYWPLRALADYLATTGDRTILDEDVPFAADGGFTGPRPVLDHVRAALDRIESTLITDTSLPAYGNGDWNDSLQPVDAARAGRLASSWTAILQTQALDALADALRDGPLVAAVADRSQRIADDGLADLRRLLLVDGVLAGYGEFHDGQASPLIHPADDETGLSFSLLPMVHAIADDQLTPAEAHDHLALIEKHLKGPDGARLFDRPPAYRGGPMQLFQRAEASTFFGREIGVMYLHAHLRYAEALARVGDGAGLLGALGQAHPVGITERVPNAAPRQSTCYYSSSDAAFVDRYAAAADYDRIGDGSVELEGGWRVYSSGPGLFLQLLVQRLLGVRHRGCEVELDPVLDADLDGLVAQVPLLGGRLRIRYRVGERGHGVRAVRIADRNLPTVRLINRYREGGVAVDAAALAPLVTDDDHLLEIVTR
ncbi:GH36-type glycosyl hydrolase domain-containing protein [Microlunatus ginsengisoli]|uniref:GH36-type glycosyl hydrolase domain-containing protein n=1 Tax=Microlunatus ginsengisoli TaxID=363863 RepID=UPI0031DE7398